MRRPAAASPPRKPLPWPTARQARLSTTPPTAPPPAAASTRYTGPFQVIAAGATTVNAVAVGTATPASTVASATFTLTYAAGAQPTYSYGNVQIVGGGFVDGIFFHPTQKGLMYARTDVGGAYRFDTNSGDTRWTPLTDFIGRQDNGFDIGVESLALDPDDPTRLYLAVGEYTESYGTNGYILASANKGQSFTAVQLPFKNGSNDNGRFAGERLAVDPANGQHLYYGSNSAGLYESTDRAGSWHAVTAFPAIPTTANGQTGGTAGDPGAGVVFEQFLPISGATNGNTTTVYVGVSDPTTGLYVSNDGGGSFTAVAGQPTGYYPNAATFDPVARYLYISYARQTGCGSACTSIGPGGPNDGQIWRYTLPTSSAPGIWTDITPPVTGNGGYGFSSVAIDPQHTDTVMVTTLNKYYPPPYDDVFRSLDDGATWVNYGTNIVRDGSLSPWINFGAATPDGGNWLNHLVVDPFNADHVLYGDGQTIWQTTDATAVDGVATTPAAVTPGNSTQWSIGAVGLEEVVVTGLTSPPSGPRPPAQRHVRPRRLYPHYPHRFGQRPPEPPLRQRYGHRLRRAGSAGHRACRRQQLRRRHAAGSLLLRRRPHLDAQRLSARGRHRGGRHDCRRRRRLYPRLAARGLGRGRQLLHRPRRHLARRCRRARAKRLHFGSRRSHQPVEVLPAQHQHR